MPKYLILYNQLISIVTLLGCKSGTNREFKKELYPSGKLKKYGYFLNYSIPVDTIYSFYESGTLKSIAIYDSTGKLNGQSAIYCESGKIKQELTYINNLVHGYVYDYDGSGNLKSKSFYCNDSAMGDYYEFENGKVTYYGLYDFQNRRINHIEYDSTGNIIKNVRQCIFLDSVRYFLDSAGVYSYNILLLISNPLKTSNKIFVRYQSSDGSVLLTDSINTSNQGAFSVVRKFSDNLSIIDISATQYDSLLVAIKSQRSKTNVEYVKR